MTIQSIGLAWVTSNNLEKSRKFFVEKLGLKETDGSCEEYGWMELTCGSGAILGVGKGCEDQKNNAAKIMPGDNAILTFSVDNLEKEIDRLKKVGVNFVGDIIEVPDIVKMIFFKDEDNNTYQLCQSLHN